MNSYENDALSYECDLTAERDRLKALNAELVAALERFSDLDTVEQANAGCEKWRVSFLFACPEYVGYCKQARATLSKMAVAK